MGIPATPAHACKRSQVGRERTPGPPLMFRDASFGLRYLPFQLGYLPLRRADCFRVHVPDREPGRFQGFRGFTILPELDPMPGDLAVAVSNHLASPFDSLCEDIIGWNERRQGRSTSSRHGAQLSRNNIGANCRTARARATIRPRRLQKRESPAWCRALRNNLQKRSTASSLRLGLQARVGIWPRPRLACRWHRRRARRRRLQDRLAVRPLAFEEIGNLFSG
jgi:hypothetical protein